MEATRLERFLEQMSQLGRPRTLAALASSAGVVPSEVAEAARNLTREARTEDDRDGTLGAHWF